MPTEVIAVDRAPWVADHTLHLLNQTASRPLSNGWIERQPTGLAMVVCNCGYASGWVAKDQLPDRDALLNEHGMPLTSQGQGSDLH